MAMTQTPRGTQTSRLCRSIVPGEGLPRRRYRRYHHRRCRSGSRMSGRSASQGQGRRRRSDGLHACQKLCCGFSALHASRPLLPVAPQHARALLYSCTSPAGGTWEEGRKLGSACCGRSVTNRGPQCASGHAGAALVCRSRTPRGAGHDAGHARAALVCGSRTPRGAVCRSRTPRGAGHDAGHTRAALVCGSHTPPCAVCSSRTPSQLRSSLHAFQERVCGFLFMVPWTRVCRVSF